MTTSTRANGGERAFEGNEPEASEVPVEPYAGAQLESEVRTFDPVFADDPFPQRRNRQADP
jgi:hypothetical protein